MIRDFTEIVQEEMHDAIKDSLSDQVIYSSHNYTFESELTATVEILGQDCVVNFSDLEAYAENMKIQTRNSVSEQSSMISKLDAIFTDARNHDDEKAINVNDEKTITADVYINTLRDLAESISVSSLGKGATSVRYNYSRFHSSFEDSIFGSSDAFAGKMDSIGGGLLKEFFDSINAVEPFDEHSTQINNLYEFLKKDPSEVKDWEMDAILMYLDSCVTVDESKGYSTVNYDRVSMILSGCYTKEEADTSSMFYSYMTYNSNDIFDYIVAEYDRHYQSKAAEFRYFDDSLKGYANLNAILTSTNFYYRTLYLTNTEDIDENGEFHPVNFGLQVYEELEEPNRIVVDTIQNDAEEFDYHLKPLYTGGTYDDTRHNIYITQANDNIQYYVSEQQKTENEITRVENALVDKLTSNTQKRIENRLLAVIKRSGPSGMVAVTAYKNLSPYTNIYGDTKKKNMEKEAESIYKRHRDYLEKMNAGGQTACCGSNMIISINEKINEPKLEISIAYYNLTHEGKDSIDKESILQDYNNFTSGKEETEGTDNIDRLCNSIASGKNQTINGRVVARDKFELEISDYLRDEYDISIEDASKGQLQEAITILY